MAKNINSTEHFGNLNADYLWSKGPKNNSCGIEYLSVNFSSLFQYVKANYYLGGDNKNHLAAGLHHKFKEIPCFLL